ncbi:MAG TPA: nucleotide-binding protein [Longimicrobium sp.]|nr:nucleotide-binding protein [Longimicrobium sp.]
MSDRPRVFIGSSKESLPVARGVKAVLEEVAEVQIWNEDVFENGRFTLEELMRFTKEYDFAVFIWAGDDRATIRANDYVVARDNVVFEAGLFMGVLGRERVFLIAQGNPSVKELSDLSGLQYDYYSVPSDNNFRSAVSTASAKIVRAIRKMGSNSHRGSPSIQCHGTKYEVPGSNSFWNGLLKNAQKRFYLVGSSNKSWVDHTEEQKLELAREIYRIVAQGGKVKLVSSDAPKAVEAHRRFFREYLRPCVEGAATNLDNAWNQVAKNLVYAVRKRSNYGAIVTDNQLVLLPSMNARDHRERSLVLEMDRGSLPYQNYEADVERLFTNGFCKPMDAVRMAHNG